MQEESKLLHVMNRILLYEHTTQRQKATYTNYRTRDTLSQNSPHKQAAKLLRAGGLQPISSILTKSTK